MSPFSRLWTTVLAILVRCPIYPLLIPPSDLNTDKTHISVEKKKKKKLRPIHQNVTLVPLTVFYHSLPRPLESSGQGDSVGTTEVRQQVLNQRLTRLISHTRVIFLVTKRLT